MGFDCSPSNWEYCARGGASYKYAGSNTADEVSWHEEIVKIKPSSWSRETK